MSTREIDWHQVRAVLAWMQIMHEEGHFPRIIQLEDAEHKIFVPMIEDAQHSTLLKRILEGKKIYAIPPPLAFSFPWYAFIEEIEAHGKIVLTPPQTGEFWTSISQWDRHPTTNKPTFSINQFDWEVTKTIKKGSAWEIKYREQGPLYNLKRLDESTWEIAPLDLAEVTKVRFDAAQLI